MSYTVTGTKGASKAKPSFAERPCFAFQAGSCAQGTECKFLHVAAETEEAKAIAVAKMAEVIK